MALYPKIQSPCPYQGDLTAVMDGDFCRMCKRRVFDLTTWSDDERVAFLSACNEAVCVSYQVPIRPAIAAAALAASAMMAPGTAAAQDSEPEISVIVGGINDPAHVRYESHADRPIPQLPVVYEDETAQKQAPTVSQQRARPARAPARN